MLAACVHAAGSGAVVVFGMKKRMFERSFCFRQKRASELMFNWYITNRSESIFFFSSLDSITWMVAAIECGIFGPGVNTYYLHIWLNFFPPGSELFCDHSVSVAHKKPDCRITIPSELAWTYSRVSIRWHGGWRVPVECANQSNTEIYT